MRKNNKECTSKDCLKPSGLINWIRCDCCSSWYHMSCVNIPLSDSKKTQWFQCPLCVDVKSVKKATIGNDLVLENYVNTTISNVRVLKRVPKEFFGAKLILFLPFGCVKMRKNNKECTSKDCLKPSGLINWIRCDCCSSSYHISCVNISLSVSKKTQWFQCPLCVDVKCVKKATIGNDLVLENYFNTAISNVRVLKRVPKVSHVPLAESLSDKINDIVYNVEDVTMWLIFLTSFLFFFWSNQKEVNANRPQA